MVVEDEMSLEKDHTPFYRWAARGKTPTVRFERDPNQSITIYGGLSLKTNQQIAYLGKDKTSKEFIAWLETLVKTYHEEITRRLPTHLEWLTTQEEYHGLILVFVDGGSCHTSKETKAWLAKHHGIIELFRFPTYSPNLNPQEKVWKALRAYLAQVQGIYSFSEQLDRASRFLLTRKFHYQSV